MSPPFTHSIVLFPQKSWVPYNIIISGNDENRGNNTLYQLPLATINVPLFPHIYLKINKMLLKQLAQRTPYIQ
jgi:hypothetical protein